MSTNPKSQWYQEISSLPETGSVMKPSKHSPCLVPYGKRKCQTLKPVAEGDLCHAFLEEVEFPFRMPNN